MRLVVTGFFTIFFSPALAFASDYDVSASGSLSDAIAAANKNTEILMKLIFQAATAIQER